MLSNANIAHACLSQVEVVLEKIQEVASNGDIPPSLQTKLQTNVSQLGDLKTSAEKQISGGELTFTQTFADVCAVCKEAEANCKAAQAVMKHMSRVGQ